MQRKLLGKKETKLDQIVVLDDSHTFVSHLMQHDELVFVIDHVDVQLEQAIQQREQVLYERYDVVEHADGHTSRVLVEQLRLAPRDQQFAQLHVKRVTRGRED